VKRLVCFLDGTWNKPLENELTNVVKLQRAIPAADAQGVRQLVHYEVGIATDVPERLKFAVGAIGLGVGDRMRGAYRFLAENYQDGDEIYLFGISRGAFEARSIAGLVALLGLTRSPSAEKVNEAWNAYEENKLREEPDTLGELRAAAHYPVRIKCVGVWDTVGNLGLPFIGRGVFKELLEFKDTELSPLVEVGLHALAIDEPRGHFSPTFWTLKKGAAQTSGQTIEQVWFPGSHENVCGGEKESALSDLTLLWMARRVAETTNLAIDLEHLHKTTAPNSLGEQLEPTSDAVHRVSHVFPFIRLIKGNRKGIPPLRRALLGNWRCTRLSPNAIPVNESIHESALARFGKRVQVRRGERVTTATYRPSNLAAVLGKEPVS
jgi:uncharacterized protein (DUF2235 family)